VFSKVNLNNKKIYISPYTNLTKQYLEFIRNKYKAFDFLGFVDSFKKGEGIISPDEIIDTYDYILVCSPNHINEIIKGLNKQRILPVYFYKQKFYLNKKPLEQLVNSKINKVKSSILNKTYRLNKYANLHLNKRAFIIANGPSLSINDINKLNNEITFAANKIWLFFNETNWRPTYYTVTDRFVMKQNIKSITDLKCKEKFFPDFLIPEIDNRIPNSIYFNTKNKPDIKFDLNEGIYTGPTVVYAMISYAIFMGIKELYIIGLDHSYEIPKKYQDYKKGDCNIIVSEGENNHFHKDYRKAGELWSQPEIIELEKGYNLINDYAKKLGIKIYNSSRKSKLEVFEKKTFDDIENL